MGHSSSMLRDGLLLSLDPHDCRVTSPHIGVLIPSGALQKELNRQQKREKINTRGIDSGKRPCRSLLRLRYLLRRYNLYTPTVGYTLLQWGVQHMVGGAESSHVKRYGPKEGEDVIQKGVDERVLDLI